MPGNGGIYEGRWELVSIQGPYVVGLVQHGLMGATLHVCRCPCAWPRGSSQPALAFILGTGATFAELVDPFLSLEGGHHGTSGVTRTQDSWFLCWALPRPLPCQFL